MFVLGAFYAALIRWNLLVPDGSHLSADTYNQAFTAHGVIMVFFFLIPSIPAVFGQLPPAADDRRAGTSRSRGSTC